MGSYVQNALIKDEQVIAEAKISLWTQWGYIFLGALFLLAALGGNGEARGGQILIAVVLLGIAYLRYTTTELAITNKRVIAKFGFISRKTIEINLSKVESVQVHQSPIGRMFNYGSLIVSGAGNPQAPVPGISDPIAFRRVAMEAQDQMPKG